LAERGVRFIQLFHRGWDQHNTLPKAIPGQARDIDRASYGLITDLKERGLLDDTLVVWGGEFGRTVYCQGKAHSPTTYGRDHHPRCFTYVDGGRRRQRRPDVWRNGRLLVQTFASDRVHVHDLHATIMQCLGVDHTRLTFKYQGRHFASPMSMACG
jgi:arylsulfatase A-like enzyme